MTASTSLGSDLDQPLNAWVKRTPLATSPTSPRLGYEGACVWDTRHHLLLRYGGHNQGGGGEQGAEVWTFDLVGARWTLKEPNLSPPGVCCNSQNVFEPVRGRYLRFPFFSGSHGWQWRRELYLNDSSVWTYDLRKNEWRDARPAVTPPTSQNDAVLTYDPLNRVVLAFVKLTTGQDEQAQHRLETWAYDTAANTWTKLNPIAEPEPSGSRARQLVFAPELNLAILENCPSKPREQQVWTYRYAQAKPGSAYNWPAPKARSQPRLAEDVVVSVLSPTRVEVTWKPPDDPTVVGYHVERAAVEVLSEDQLQRLKRNTPPLAGPRVGAIQRIGPFSRLTTAPLKETRFSDTTIDLTKSQPAGDEPAYTRRFSSEELDTTGKPYRLAVFAYRVRAVNTAGLQSGPSPACFTIPSSPQWLFSKETGQTCQLKWSANLEKGISGYRVYRMDGRYDNEPVSRLSPEPITALTYQDPTAGKSTRRYYVVAVDAMGQEGFPSSPAWFNREWRSFYAPFLGEWHQ